MYSRHNLESHRWEVITVVNGEEEEEEEEEEKEKQ